MREFFRGWKRKAGCVTLVLACVFAAGWVRSLSTLDQINCPQGPFKEEKFQSMNSCLVWFSDLADVQGGSIGGGGFGDSSGPAYDMKVRWVSGRIHEGNFRPDQKHPAVVWQFRLLGVGVGRFRDTSMGVCFMRYESIVISLTAISAWMLMSKPRAKPEPSIEPASENA